MYINDVFCIVCFFVGCVSVLLLIVCFWLCVLLFYVDYRLCVVVFVFVMFAFVLSFVCARDVLLGCCIIH